MIYYLGQQKKHKKIALTPSITRPGLFLHLHHLCNIYATLSIIDDPQIKIEIYIFLFMTLIVFTWRCEVLNHILRTAFWHPSYFPWVKHLRYSEYGLLTEQTMAALKKKKKKKRSYQIVLSGISCQSQTLLCANQINRPPVLNVSGCLILKKEALVKGFWQVELLMKAHGSKHETFHFLHFVQCGHRFHSPSLLSPM